MTPTEFKEKYAEKRYMGDGLYAHFDGWHIILSAPREGGLHYVALEPPVFENVLEFREQIYQDAKTITKEPRNENEAF